MTRSKDKSLKTFNNAAADYDAKYESWSNDTHPFILNALESEPFTSILDVDPGEFRTLVLSATYFVEKTPK